MLTIHHSKQSRSMRVVWLCEELAIPYQIEPVEMFTPEMKRPEYLAIHPLGKVPAIEDDDFVLWETTAIFEYLVARHGDADCGLIPAAGTREGALCAQWMAYGENPLTVIMGEVAAHSGPIPEEMRMPALVERGKEIGPSLVGVVERALGDAPFILGENFSAADIMLGFGLNIAGFLGFVNPSTPRTAAYCERLSARPACIRASEV